MTSGTTRRLSETRVRFRFRSRETAVEEAEKEHPLLRAIRRQNKDGANVIALVSGRTRSGKSELLAKLIEELDPGFIQSFRDGTPHLSVSPVPFFKALDARILPPGSWWMIDEPTGVKNTEWYTEIGKALRDILTSYAYTVVNLGVCVPIVDKLQSDLKNNCHFWVRMYHPGHAGVREMVQRVNYSRAANAPLEVVKPSWLGKLTVGRTSEEFDSYYKPLKTTNFQGLTHGWIERLSRQERQRGPVDSKRPYVT